MMPARGLFWPVHSVFLALAGGQGPAGWEREMARRTTRLDGLRRACAWGEQMVAVRPRLRDEPLLGHWLEALTARVARPTEPRPEEPPSRGYQPARPQPALGLEQGAFADEKRVAAPLWPVPSPGLLDEKGRPQAPGARPTSRPAPDPAQLEARASRSLLSRLAGGTAQTPGAPQTRGRPGKGPARPKSAAVLTASQDSSALHRWLDDVARRVERSLLRPPPTTPLAPGATPSTWSIPPDSARGWARSAHDRPPFRGEVPSLPEQWAKRLDGQPAPANLLARLSGLPQAGGHSSGRASQPARTRSPELSAPVPARGERSWQIEEGRAPVDLWGRLASAGDGGHIGRHLPPGSASRRTHERGAGDSRGEGVDEVAASARVAPPRVAPSLAPLLPSQRVEMPSPPIATAIVRQGARQEESLPAEDDLSELAAKVKRILDEEARRHGIDV